MKNILPLLIVLLACQKSQTQPEPPKEITYDANPQSFPLSGKIKEASGITFSTSIAEHYWVNQDSGNPPVLYLLKRDGTIADSVTIEQATNRDWEDITTGSVPGDAKKYLFVGDIGDNEAKYPDCTIYRFPEPTTGTTAVSAYDRIKFVYEDSAHDAEALLVDNSSGNIYIITKRDVRSRIYKLSYPQSTTSLNEAKLVAELDYSGVVSAALSENGEELIIKTYTQVRHYMKNQSQNLEDVFRSVTPKLLAYQLEPQGEAVCFAKDGSGFYTLSEEAMGIVPKLFFYRKN